MRIAIATEDGYVAPHFGRCPSYTIADIKDGRVEYTEVIKNPGHEPGLLPKLLHSKGVNCVIAGGMGPRAIGFFNDFGIKTLIGVSGKIEDVISEFVKGTLKEGKSQCDHPHEHKYLQCKKDKRK